MKAAVIGLGRVGFDFGLETGRTQPASHVACYNVLGQITSLAVVDSNPKKLTPALQSISKTNKKAYESAAEMLLEFQPEIVSVCTPTPTHHQMIQLLTKHSCVKSVFLEKPIAQSLKEADDIINRCKKAGIRLTVNNTRRWNPVYQRLFLKYSSGDKPHSIVGIHPGPLLRTGIHMIDIFNWIFGKPWHVQAFGAPWSNYIGGDDNNLNGALDYHGNCDAILISGCSIENLVLFELDVRSQKERVKILDNGETCEEYIVKSSKRYSGLKEYEFALSFKSWPASPLLSAVEEVCMMQKNSCTGEDARLALQVALGINYSYKHKNQLIDVDDVPLDYKVKSY